MFENIKEPEDMFANTETVSGPRPSPTPVSASTSTVRESQTQAEVPSAPASYPVESVSSGPRIPWKLLVVIMGSILVVGIAGALSYYLLVGRASGVPEVPEQAEEESAAGEAVDIDAGRNEGTDEAAIQEVPITTKAPVVEPDSDQDGLSDAEEAALGTSVSSQDTDEDGLFDREEVEVYKTNPLDSDTDGDTYQDGAEVSGGYNPNGSGKLFELPGND